MTDKNKPELKIETDVASRDDMAPEVVEAYELANQLIHLIGAKLGGDTAYTVMISVTINAMLDRFPVDVVQAGLRQIVDQIPEGAEQMRLMRARGLN